MTKADRTKPAVMQGALWTQFVHKSPLQDAAEILARPGVISFSLGLPSTDLFPFKEFMTASVDTLQEMPNALQYGPPSAELKLRIVALMRVRGVECSERQIFLTSGAQQAIHLLASLLLDRGQQIIAEEISYPGFRHIVEFYEPEIFSVPTDPMTGMDVDKVEWHLANGVRPAFVYSIPDGHNPLGVSMSVEKRDRLVFLAQHYGVNILEDDPYGFLFYSNVSPSPLRARCEERVYYIGSLSKILAPSIRVGWLVVPERLIPYLAILKEASDIHAATFSQHVVARLLGYSFLPQHMQRLRLEYGCRRNVMLTALSRLFPPNTMWASSECGLYVWVRLPNYIDTMQLLKVAATEYGVTFMPGSAFCMNDAASARSNLRLNFSHPSVESIEEGMRRLGAAVTSAINNA